MAGEGNEGLGARLWRLKPVLISYAVLLGVSALGYVLEPVSPEAALAWFVFFLAPFSVVYCIPFGMGMGILSQRLVWYTAPYGHRLVGVCTGVVAVAMIIAWGKTLVENFDIVYLMAVIWPIVASGLSMLVGMYYVRAEEYEEAMSYEEDDYPEDYDYLED